MQGFKTLEDVINFYATRRFDRSFTVAAVNNAGPIAEVIDLNLPRYDIPLWIEGWISNFGSSNVHIFQDDRTVTDCQYQLENGATDMIMTLTGSGPSKVMLPDNVSRITVFYEAQNTSGQSQVTTIRVHS